MRKFYNTRLKERTDFNLGSLSDSIKKSNAEMRGELNEICTKFNGLRGDLFSTNERLRANDQAIADLLIHVKEIIGCEITHLIDDISFERECVESDEAFLGAIVRIDNLENPFTRLRKMRELNDKLEESKEAFREKAQAIHERLKLSEGVQTEENVTAHKMLEKMNRVIAGLDERQNKLTALRSNLYGKLKRDLERNKPEISFN